MSVKLIILTYLSSVIGIADPTHILIIITSIPWPSTFPFLHQRLELFEETTLATRVQLIMAKVLWRASIGLFLTRLIRLFLNGYYWSGSSFFLSLRNVKITTLEFGVLRNLFKHNLNDIIKIRALLFRNESTQQVFNAT